MVYNITSKTVTMRGEYCKFDWIFFYIHLANAINKEIIFFGIIFIFVGNLIRGQMYLTKAFVCYFQFCWSIEKKFHWEIQVKLQIAPTKYLFELMLKTTKPIPRRTYPLWSLKIVRPLIICCLRVWATLIIWIFDFYVDKVANIIGRCN